MAETNFLGAIFKKLREECPLPVGWAYLQPPHQTEGEPWNQFILAHVTIDQNFQINCDKSVVLKALDGGDSPSVVRVTFNEFSHASTYRTYDDFTSNSTSLKVSNLDDITAILKGQLSRGSNGSDEGDEQEGPESTTGDAQPKKKVAKKSTGGLLLKHIPDENAPSPSVQSEKSEKSEKSPEDDGSMDCYVDEPKRKRSRPPSPEAEDDRWESASPDVEIETIASVRPVTLHQAIPSPHSLHQAGNMHQAIPSRPQINLGGVTFDPYPLPPHRSIMTAGGNPARFFPPMNSYHSPQTKMTNGMNPGPSSSLQSKALFAYCEEKERPYKCPECGRTFRRGNHLKDHMRTHVGETYQCPVCSYECILQTKFTAHMTNSHNNKGPFKCDTCGEFFERAHDLARHLPKDHQIDTGFRISHFKTTFNAQEFKEKSGSPSLSLPINRGAPAISSITATTSPAIAAVPVSLPSEMDFGDGSFEDMQRLMKLYASAPAPVVPIEADGGGQTRVRSLEDEFGDDDFDDGGDDRFPRDTKVNDIESIVIE